MIETQLKLILRTCHERDTTTTAGVSAAVYSHLNSNIKNIVQFTEKNTQLRRQFKREFEYIRDFYSCARTIVELVSKKANTNNTSEQLRIAESIFAIADSMKHDFNNVKDALEKFAQQDIHQGVAASAKNELESKRFS